MSLFGRSLSMPVDVVATTVPSAVTKGTCELRRRQQAKPRSGLFAMQLAALRLQWRGLKPEGVSLCAQLGGDRDHAYERVGGHLKELVSEVSAGSTAPAGGCLAGMRSASSPSTRTPECSMPSIIR